MSNVLTKEYFEKHLDQEFAKRDKLLDKRFERQEENFKSYVDRVLKSNREEFQLYVERCIGVVGENFQHHLQMLAENVMGLHQKFDKLDGRVENLETDMRYIKATLAVADII